jgi:hypothetical protein
VVQRRSAGGPSNSGQLANKDGPRIADWPRKLSLGIQASDAVGAAADPTHVKIDKGSDHAIVKYQSPNKVGRFILTATGAGLENCKHEIRSVRLCIGW